MFTSRDPECRTKYSIKIDNRSFEGEEDFKYLGKTLTNENSIQEDIKSRLKSGNTCCHSVQNISFSRFLSKNINTKTLPVDLYVCV
jgi:hypothetical protein